jgi:hypothetical protein
MQAANGHRVRDLIRRLNQSHSEAVSSCRLITKAAGEQVKELKEELRITRREETEAIDWLKETLVG